MDETANDDVEVGPVESFETLEDPRWEENSIKSDIDTKSDSGHMYNSLDDEVTIPSDEIQKPWAEFDLAND